MRLVAPTLAALCLLLVLGPFASQTSVGQQTVGPRLLSYFPREGTVLLPTSNISVVFSELMDAPSVNASLVVKTDLGVDVQLELSGECGDPTTLVFSPISGSWPTGNYTMLFTKAVKTARGSTFIPLESPVHFSVEQRDAMVVQATVIDAAGAISNVRSGVSIQVSPGNETLDLGFSVDIDIGKFLDALSGKPPSKISECQGVSVSVSLSLSASVTVQIVLNSTNAVDRNNATDRLGIPFIISLIGMSGPPPGLDLGPLAPALLAFDIVGPIVVGIIVYVLAQRRTGRKIASLKQENENLKVRMGLSSDVGQAPLEDEL